MGEEPVSFSLADIFRSKRNPNVFDLSCWEGFNLGKTSAWGTGESISIHSRMCIHH